MGPADRLTARAAGLLARGTCLVRRRRGSLLVLAAFGLGANVVHDYYFLFRPLPGWCWHLASPVIKQGPAIFLIAITLCIATMNPRAGERAEPPE